MTVVEALEMAGAGALDALLVLMAVAGAIAGIGSLAALWMTRRPKGGRR